MKSFIEMEEEIAAVNRANGWFDSHRTFGEDIALLHSEVSEAFEAYRSWGLRDMTSQPEGGLLPKPEGVGSEFADVLIRLLDSCYRSGVDLEAEYERKLAHNRVRGYRHGGKAV